MASTLKATLRAMMNDQHEVRVALRELSNDHDRDEADLAHVKRWAEDWHDDRVWAGIESDIRMHGLVPAQGIYETVIYYALLARHIAELAASGEDPILIENLQRRSELLSLAAKADDLAKYYREAEQYSGIASFFERFLLPMSQLRQLHEQEAKLLRQRAGRAPNSTTRISRQRRGKERDESRVYVAFMYFMVRCMREVCGKPRYDDVAAMTNIAFPSAAVTKDDVRSACRPTTRKSRLGER
jgi:hypothetical protein